jgi:hypothetical protein
MLQFLQRFITINITICITALISGCGGPFSVVPYMASASLGAYETHRLREEAEQKKYIKKCLPTERPVDALIAGVNTEREAARIVVANDPEKLPTSQNKLVEAYTYYKIAETLGDERADAHLVNIRGFMSEMMIDDAEQQFKKYTLDNILSCYQPVYVAGSDYY